MKHPRKAVVNLHAGRRVDSLPRRYRRMRYDDSGLDDYEENYFDCYDDYWDYREPMGVLYLFESVLNAIEYHLFPSHKLIWQDLSPRKLGLPCPTQDAAEGTCVEDDMPGVPSRGLPTALASYLDLASFEMGLLVCAFRPGRESPHCGNSLRLASAGQVARSAS